MKYKYEDWILHLVLILFLIFIWIVMFRKIHHPKYFSQKDFYSKGLSFRFYISVLILLGMTFALIRDFINLYNQ